MMDKALSQADFDRLNVFAWRRGYLVVRTGYTGKRRYAVIRKPDLNRMLADNVGRDDARVAVKSAARLFTSGTCSEMYRWIEENAVDRPAA
ncbi:hypothetical protein SAMN02990966_06926 [Rhodospirillales bacterium URHD0017]|nr:hypothetical protein SAMN02990966_06926 [Rhodospirillales bacterium URHD0017]